VVWESSSKLISRAIFVSPNNSERSAEGEIYDCV